MYQARFINFDINAHEAHVASLKAQRAREQLRASIARQHRLEHRAFIAFVVCASCVTFVATFVAFQFV